MAGLSRAAALAAVAFAGQSAAQDLPPPAVSGPTPMTERELVLGLLDKASGEASEITLRPGSSYRFERLTIHVRACTKTPPWERPYTGAFLQIEEPQRSGMTRTVYSGWMYAEFPSLNSLDHAAYDVWVKACRMSFPDTGPATVEVP